MLDIALVQDSDRIIFGNKADSLVGHGGSRKKESRCNSNCFKIHRYNIQNSLRQSYAEAGIIPHS